MTIVLIGRGWLLGLGLLVCATATAHAQTSVANTPDAIAAVRTAIEKKVDADALTIRGTILRIVYSVAAEDDGYLVRIDACNRKSKQGRTILLVQAPEGKTAGEKWPAPDKNAVIYLVGTSVYDAGNGKSAVVPLYVPDRDTAVIWTLSQ